MVINHHSLPDAARAIPERVAKPDEQQTLPLRLRSIRGLNHEVGLAIVRGNTSKYLTLLSLFAKSHQKHSGQIQEFLKAETMPSLETIAYSLHGSAGMVGAQSISAAANSVLAALRNNCTDEVEQYGMILAEELSSLITGIQCALPDRGDRDETESILPDTIEQSVGSQFHSGASGSR